MNSKCKKLFLITLLLGIRFIVNAQTNQVDQNNQNIIDNGHLDLIVEEAKGDYQTFPVGKYGVLFCYKSVEKNKSGFFDFNITKLDTSFVENFKMSEGIPKNYEVIDFKNENQFAYFLLADDKNSRKSPFFMDAYFHEYTLLKVNVETKATTVFHGKTSRAFFLKEMILDKGIVTLVGKSGASEAKLSAVMGFSFLLFYSPMLFYTPNYDPLIHSIDMNAKMGVLKEYNMKEYFRGDAGIIDIDYINGDFTALIKHKIKRKSTYSIRNLENNVLKSDIPFEFPKGLEMYKSKVNSLPENKKVIVGTYGKITGTKRGTGNGSQGIYVSMMENNIQKMTTLIPWKKFERFQLPLTQSEAFRLDRTKNGKKDPDILMQVIFHDVIVKDDEYTFIGEIFYPEYHTVTTKYVDSKGATSYKREVFFDGIRYAGIISFAVNGKGEIIWETGETFPDGKLRFEVKEQMQFYETGDDQYSAVFYRKHLNLFTFYGDNTSPIISKNSSEIYTRKTDDKSLNYKYYDASFKPWYGNNYFVGAASTEQSKSKKKDVKYYYSFNKLNLPILGQ